MWGSVELLREHTKLTPFSYTWSINHTSLCEHSKTVIGEGGDRIITSEPTKIEKGPRIDAMTSKIGSELKLCRLFRVCGCGIDWLHGSSFIGAYQLAGTVWSCPIIVLEA
jgi:hypothetical protein